MSTCLHGHGSTENTSAFIIIMLTLLTSEHAERGRPTLNNAEQSRTKPFRLMAERIFV